MTRMVMVSSAKQCLGQRLVWWTEKRHQDFVLVRQIQPQEANIFFSLFVSERHGGFDVSSWGENTISLASAYSHD